MIGESWPVELLREQENFWDDLEKNLRAAVHRQIDSSILFGASNSSGVWPSLDKPVCWPGVLL